MKRDFDQAEKCPAFVELFGIVAMAVRLGVSCVRATVSPARSCVGDGGMGTLTFSFLPEVIDRSVAKRIPKLLRRESRTRNPRQQAQ